MKFLQYFRDSFRPRLHCATGDLVKSRIGLVLPSHHLYPEDVDEVSPWKAGQPSHLDAATCQRIFYWILSSRKLRVKSKGGSCLRVEEDSLVRTGGSVLVWKTCLRCIIQWTVRYKAGTRDCPCLTSQTSPSAVCQRVSETSSVGISTPLHYFIEYWEPTASRGPVSLETCYHDV